MYSYTATTYDGEVIEGVVEAPDERSAVEKIRNTGNIPIRISAPKTGVGRKSSSLKMSCQEKI